VGRIDKGGLVDWDAGREGYERVPISYAPAAPVTKNTGTAPANPLQSIRREERFGSLIAAAGTIWIVYVATQDYTNLWRLQINPPGPLEVTALGILVWLHAKWRRNLSRV
jgi:hypothetical protein